MLFYLCVFKQENNLRDNPRSFVRHISKRKNINFRKTLGNDDDEENDNDEFEAERQGKGRR